MPGTIENYQFGPFELDVDAGELRRDGRRRSLQAQPLKLLILLVRRAGTVVTYEDIRRELWDEETYVEFDQGVHFAIRRIREALGDAAGSPLYIETVPKRGYRFVAPVTAAGDKDGPAAEPARPRAGATARLQKALWENIVEIRVAETRRQRTQTYVMALLILAILIGAVAIVVLLVKSLAH